MVHSAASDAWQAVCESGCHQQLATPLHFRPPRCLLGAAVSVGGVVGKAQRVAFLARIDHPLQAARNAWGGQGVVLQPVHLSADG